MVRAQLGGSTEGDDSMAGADATWVADLVTRANWKLDAMMPILAKLAADSDSVSPEELAAFTAVAEKAAATQAGATVKAVLAMLPAGSGGGLSAEQVEQAVRDAFAGGLAPE